MRDRGRYIHFMLPTLRIITFIWILSRKLGRMIISSTRYRVLTGRYIKEFVHGDLGRTKPNLASLLHWDELECDIVLLDGMKFILIS